MAKKKEAPAKNAAAEAPVAKDGTYVVLEGNRVKHGGAMHDAGAELELTADEVKPLLAAGAVEAV